MHASCAPTRARPALELADVVRAHGKAFLERHALRPEQRAGLRAIEQSNPCLGGHLDVCGACGYERPSYNSCRNRHCPKSWALCFVEKCWMRSNALTLAGTSIWVPPDKPPGLRGQRHDRDLVQTPRYVAPAALRETWTPIDCAELLKRDHDVDADDELERRALGGFQS